MPPPQSLLVAATPTTELNRWVIDERGKIDGDAEIAQDTRLYGMIAGSATVAAGIKLVVHGMIGGNLVVEAGANVEVYGTVFGDVINRGGDLQVIGRVRGDVRREAGSTRIDQDAIITGQVR